MLDIDMQEIAKKLDKDTEKEPKGTKFYPAEEVVPMANELITKYHPHLLNAKISYMFRDGKWNKDNRPVVGDVKLMSPYYKTLTGLDFGIVLNAKLWLNTTRVKQKQAMLDHLLSYCYFTEDKDGNPKWKKVAPTIHEFPEVVARNGAYSPDVMELENSLREFEKEN